MKISKKQGTEILTLLAVVIAFYVVLKIVLIPVVISEGFRTFIESLGVGGYFVVIGYTVLSHVFAPLAGTPGVLLSITIYGLQVGILLLYIAGLISAVVNFWISRKFGRQLVTQFVGKRSMREIDAFTAIEGKKVLFISRLFGISIFEFISYAAGLTNVSFKDYFAITALVSIVPNAIAYVLLRDLDFYSETGILIWIGLLLVAGVIFGFFVKQYLRVSKPE